jgi:hypothetical protein
MAIYYHRMFCSEHQRLELKQEIIFEDIHIPAGEMFTVVRIIGSGYDVIAEKKGIEFRFLNSEMPEFFHPPRQDDNVVIEEVKNISNKTAFGKILAEQNIVMFTSDLEIRDVITIAKGTRYYFQKDGDYFNLFAPSDFHKELRLSRAEMREYCMPLEMPVEVEELV